MSERLREFVLAAAEATAPGARVLDVGAGGAPYGELFEHVDYATADWDSSGALRVEERAFDVVLSTHVLERAPEPQRAMGELHRVLVEGGSLCLSVSLVRELGARAARQVLGENARRLFGLDHPS